MSFLRELDLGVESPWQGEGRGGGSYFTIFPSLKLPRSTARDCYAFLSGSVGLVLQCLMVVVIISFRKV